MSIPVQSYAMIPARLKGRRKTLHRLPPLLPPLDCLRFFEAAARSQSFRRAAEELGVTGPAVAQRIRTLEKHLGYDLFERRARGVVLNSRGMAYYTEIQSLLAQIHDVTARHRSANGRLRIVSVESIAERVLMPRLAEFRAAHPDIVIELETNHRGMDSSRRDFDAWIAYVGETATPHPEGLDAEPLFEERLFPVCSPGLLKELGRPVGPSDLKNLPLLVDLGWDGDWAYWFACQGERMPDLSNAWAFRLYSMVVDAAIAGMGVALGHGMLIARELASGRLVPLLTDDDPPTTRCCLITTDSAKRKPGLQEFRHWLRGLVSCAAG